MKKATIAAAALSLAVLAPPVTAQDASTENANAKGDRESSEADVAAMMKSMFQVEPLTAEQAARLPQAQAVIARIMPPGTLQQVMGGMFDKMLGPMLALDTGADSASVARELGVEDEEFALEEEDAARVGAILDPVRQQRQKLEAEATQRGMMSAMTAMEPGMRKGMAEAYAATFTTTELTAIDTFFRTPEGASFASKSYALASDPRILASAMDGLPAMMEQMKTTASEIKAATASLPPRRSYTDLSASERAEIARLTGLEQGAIREGMERAAKARDAEETE